MAGKRRRRQPRSRPAPSEVRAVLDGYAVPAGGANADMALSALAPVVSAFAGASVPGAVARIWDAAGPADATPARGYLSRRGCWPGRHVRAPLPESVRWLAREVAPERDEAEGWHGLPPGAAGAVAFAWRRSGVQDGPPVAVTLVALDARGFPVPEARSTIGSCAGAMFRAGDRGDEGAVRVWADEDGQPHANGWLETPWLEVFGKEA